MLQPLGMLAALIVAFHGVAGVSTEGVPYVPFAMTGLAAWTLIQMTLLNGTMSFSRTPCSSAGYRVRASRSSRAP